MVCVLGVFVRLCLAGQRDTELASPQLLINFRADLLHTPAAEGQADGTDVSVLRLS
jgi:hypothetical protein